MFKLTTNFSPKGDQPIAIEKLIKNLNKNNEQILMGATGTGKTFTIANVINKLNLPTLVIVHNKTLAMQLYNELKAFFPKNKVEYFVSIFDFYTPEAYVVKSDMYIDKNSKSNLELTMMRRSAQNSLLTRKDTIVVASVAAIYGLDDPNMYKKSFFVLKNNQEISRNKIIKLLVKNGYLRNNTILESGYFIVKGDNIKIALGWTELYYLRIILDGDKIERISKINPLNNNVIEDLYKFTIFPASNYILNKNIINDTITEIQKELENRKKYFQKNNKLIELQRITQRTEQDIDTLLEFGYCSGIENYSAIIEKRKKGIPPFTLLDYFDNKFLTIVDESHITLPQIKGMFNGDRNRKENLVNYGFRLPSALDNRPLKFEEFIKKINKIIYVSATPGDYELKKLNNKTVEQIIRPTGLLDPIIEIRKTKNQILDIIDELKIRKKNNERVFIITLTIAMSEDLTSYLQDKKIKVAYLHNKLKTLERNKILNELRRGVYDVVVGINLLREGLDIPEVSLIAILDADKEGFLRNKRSLIQIIGRVARNKNGKTIMYADTITSSMKDAIKETNRRRKIQEIYNKNNSIIPETIKKPIPENKFLNELTKKINKLENKSSKKYQKLQKEKIVNELKRKMLEASSKLDFEKASEYRDLIMEIDTAFNK